MASMCTALPNISSNNDPKSLLMTWSIRRDILSWEISSPNRICVKTPLPVSSPCSPVTRTLIGTVIILSSSSAKIWAYCLLHFFLNSPGSIFGMVTTAWMTW
jgi:hypothetical protein